MFPVVSRRSANPKAHDGDCHGHARRGVQLGKKSLPPDFESHPQAGRWQQVERVIQPDTALSEKVGGGFFNRRHRHGLPKRLIGLQLTSAKFTARHVQFQAVAVFVGQLSIDVLHNQLLCVIAFHGLLLKLKKYIIFYRLLSHD
jgi:hypothetical protein